MGLMSGAGRVKIVGLRVMSRLFEDISGGGPLEATQSPVSVGSRFDSG